MNARGALPTWVAEGMSRLFLVSPEAGLPLLRGSTKPFDSGQSRKLPALPTCEWIFEEPTRSRLSSYTPPSILPS